MNVNLMIYILGNENQTYNKIYNPVGVPCDIFIYVSPLYSVLIHRSFCPGKMPIQSSTTWIFQLFRYPLPRNEASFEFRWGFMVPRVMWLKNSMFSLLYTCPQKLFKGDAPPAPPKKTEGYFLKMARSCSILTDDKGNNIHEMFAAEVKCTRIRHQSRELQSVLPGEGFKLHGEGFKLQNVPKFLWVFVTFFFFRSF